MTPHSYCKTLQQFRSDGVRVCNFFGWRWAVWLAISGAFGLLLLCQPDDVLRGAGIFMLGYLVGAGAGGLRSFLKMRRTWPLATVYVDWPKVDDTLATAS